MREKQQEHAPDSLLPSLMSRLGLNTTQAANAQTPLGQRLNTLQHAPLATLLVALDDEDESVRAMAVRALEQWGKQVPPERVLACLNDSSWLVREAALLTLERLKLPIPLGQWKTLRQDNNLFVRDIATEAFTRLHPLQRLWSNLDFLWLLVRNKGAKQLRGDNMDIQNDSSQPISLSPHPQKHHAMAHRIEGLVAATIIIGLVTSWIVLTHGYLGSSLGQGDSHLGPPIWTYHSDNYRPDQITWTPDNKHLSLFGGEDTIHVLDTTTKQLKAYSMPYTVTNSQAVPGQRGGQEELSPDGQYVSGIDNTQGQQPILRIQIWEVTSGKRLLNYSAPFPSPANQFPQIAWSPDSTFVAASDGGNLIYLWKVGAQKPYTLNGNSNQLNQETLTWSQNGRYVGASTKDGSALELWDISTGRRSFTSSFNGTIVSFGLSFDGKLVAVATTQKMIQVVDTETNKQLHSYQSSVEDAYLSPQWTNDGKHLIAVNEDSSAKTESIRMWDITKGLLIDEPINYQGNAMLSPNGIYLAAETSDKSSMQVWDTTTGKKLVTHTNASVPLNEFTIWSPNGRYITTVRSDNSVQIWDGATGNTVYTYPGSSQMILETTWSPNGAYFAILRTTKSQAWFSSSFSMKGCTIEIWHAPK